MEKRALLALIVCGTILVLYYWVLVPMISPARPVRPTPATAEAEPAKPEPTGTTRTAPGPSTLPIEIVTETIETEVAPWSGRLVNEWLETTWTNDATGSCTRIRFLKEFYADVKGNPLYVTGGYRRVEWERVTGTTAASVIGRTARGGVLPGSFRVRAAEQEARDDGEGRLIGDVNAQGANRIDYRTGTFEVTFGDGFEEETEVVCSYDPAAMLREVYELEKAAGDSAHYVGKVPFGPVRPGTFRMVADEQVVYDDGEGSLIGGVLKGTSSAIDYGRGAYDVTFAAVVSKGTVIRCQYNDHDPRVLDVSLVDPPVDLSNVRFGVVKSGPEGVVFRGVVREGTEPLLEVTKTVTLPGDGFVIRTELTFRNVSGRRLSLRYDVGASQGMRVENPAKPEVAARITTLSQGKTHAERREVGKLVRSGWVIPERVSDVPTVVWAGAENRYFAMALIAGVKDPMQQATGRTLYYSRPEVSAHPTVMTRMQSPLLELDPGQTSQPRTLELFVGPKRNDVLEQHASAGLPQLLDYGMFGIVAKVLLIVLHFFYGVVRNYGLAIILLTVLIRVVLHPLTKHSQVSMHRMQALQPKIKELQQKYKNDKQRLGSEQMKLFREQGANPFSGCLPMLLQIPILWGLWRGLNAAFELRQAPFFLWIQDLSQPDAMPFPFVGSINLLPVLMTAAMFIQQLMTPQSPDPQTAQQQKMFRFFPLIFGFMFYSFPSGLCLYWFTSTLLGMGEQYIVKRHLDKEHPNDVACKTDRKSKGG